MRYTIEDLENGYYRINFCKDNQQPSKIFYEFETASESSDDENIKKLEQAMMTNFKTEHLTIENMFPIMVIHYIPNNILRVIDRVSKVVNSVYSSGSYKIFDNYENLFSEVLLPYGKFLSKIDIETDKETCKNWLYNKKIIDEQIYTPKLSISNCLNYCCNDEFWNSEIRNEEDVEDVKDDKDVADADVKNVLQSQNDFDVLHIVDTSNLIENTNSKIQYAPESFRPSDSLENQNLNTQLGGDDLEIKDADVADVRDVADVQILIDTIKRQRIFIKSLQNEIDILKYQLELKK